MTQGKHKRTLHGLHDRIEDAVFHSGLSKSEIARRGSFDRKSFYTEMTPVVIARICEITKVSADYILGLSKEMTR